jgi:hypothetical protein
MDQLLVVDKDIAWWRIRSTVKLRIIETQCKDRMPVCCVNLR